MKANSALNSALSHTPVAFALVQPGIYRFEIPQPHHLPFLRALRLQSAILLTSESLSRPVLQFLNDQQIKLVAPRLH